jgi:hypothetical protein
VSTSGRWAGRGLMTAGAIVSAIGLGIVLMKTIDLPGYWMPLIVGVRTVRGGRRHLGDVARRVEVTRRA